MQKADVQDDESWASAFVVRQGLSWFDGDIIRILYGKYNLHFGRLMVTPSANRNSCRVAKRVGDDTQGRGAAHLNPGLGNRNSYRVASGCVPTRIISTHSKDRDLHGLNLEAE